MATRARLSQDRSRLRRDELLDAAIALFADGGARGITHRAVAAKAGLPSATTTYYFPSIDELIEAALSRHIENWLTDVHALTSLPIDANFSLDNMNNVIATVFSVRSTEVVGLNLSIYLAAARTPELRPKAAEAMNALEDLVSKRFQHLGLADPESLAKSVVIIIAGSALGRLSERHTNDEEATILFRSLRGVITAALLNDDEIKTKMERLGGGHSSHYV